MDIFPVVPGMTLELGKTGTHYVRAFRFDISAWQEAYPDGIINLIHRLPDANEPYVAGYLRLGEGYIDWVVQSSDVAVPGYGECELVMIVDGVAVDKTDTYPTHIEEQLGTNSVTPPTGASWVEQVLTVGNATLQAVDGFEDLVAEKEQDITDLASGKEQNITDLAAQKIAAIEAKGAETLDSIPEDYTALSDEVDDLKSTFEKLYEPYNLYDKDSAEDGWFTAPDGSNASNSSWCRLRRIYVTAGDTLSITGGRFMTCFFSADTLNPSDVVSGGADYSSGQELITVPSGATVMSVSALVANKSKMLVVKSDSIVTEYLPYGTVKPADTFDVYSKEEVDDILNATATIVTIGTDYANLRLALEDIATKNTSYKNRYLVKIPKGTYDIRSLFTSSELATTKGLYVPPFTKIQGVGNPSEVVLNWINPEVNSAQAVLNLDCTAELENLTLHGEKLRYALHDDWTVRKWDGVTPYSEYWYDAFVNKGWVRTVKNCIFDVVDSPVRPAWGAGVVNGVRWLFENCTFITNKAYAGSCHNDTNFSMPCYIVFRNCIFTAADTYFLRLPSIVNNANGIINQVTFEGCMNTNGLKFILTEENVSQFGSGCLWSVNGFGNAFGNLKGQISVTDGQDYSSRLKLIG